MPRFAFDVTLVDPFDCTGPGDVLTVTAAFTNNSPGALAGVTYQANLPPELTGVPGSCTVSDGTHASCIVGPNSVSWTGNWPGTASAPANTVTIRYQVTVGAGLAPGTDLCIDSSVAFDPGGGQMTIEDTACGSVTCPLPTGVTLTYFKAFATGVDEVAVAWGTANEAETLGFNVLRAASAAGPYTQVNEALVPAAGGTVRGGDYVLRDRSGPGTFHYRLEVVGDDGRRTRHAPVTVRADASVRERQSYLPLLKTRWLGALSNVRRLQLP